MNAEELFMTFWRASERECPELPQMGAKFSRFKTSKIEVRPFNQGAIAVVSDYFESAPAEVIECLATHVAKERKVMRYWTVHEFNLPDKVAEWTRSDDFNEANREKAVRRLKAPSDPVGAHKDLRESYARLVKANLVPEDAGITMGWVHGTRWGTCGYLNTDFRCVALDDRYDSDEVGDAAVDWALYEKVAEIMVSQGLMGCDRKGCGELHKTLKRFAYRYGSEAVAYAVNCFNRISVGQPLPEAPTAEGAKGAERWMRRTSRTTTGKRTSSTPKAVITGRGWSARSAATLRTAPT